MFYNGFLMVFFKTLNRLNHQLGPTELVALLKIVSLLSEHSPYSKLESRLLDQVINLCLDLDSDERNPVIQVSKFYKYLVCMG